MSGRAGQSAASACGSSSGFSQTPMSARAINASRAASQSASGTMLAARGTSSTQAASRTSVQRSSMIEPSLMSRGIDALLERLEPQSAHGVEETLVLVAVLDVDVDQSRDDVGHVVRREGRSDHLAERRRLALRTADRDLIPLLAVLIDPEHADVAHAVVAAGVHAAGNIQVDIAEVVDIIEKI